MSFQFRKLTTAERLTRMKIELQDEQPFWSRLILNLNIQEDTKNMLPSYGSVGVDIRNNLYYEKKFIDGLSDPELKFVLAHEVSHIIFGHLWRLGNRKPMKFNCACDLVVNTILKMNNFTPPKDGLFADHNHSYKTQDVIITDIDKKSAEQLYDLLPDIPEQKITVNIKGNDSGEGSGQGDNYGGQWDHHFYEELSAKDKKKLEEHWTDQIIDSANFAKQKGCVPVGMDRYIKEILNPQIHWRHLLYKYITAQIPFDFTYARRSKKSMASGYYMPAVLKETIDIVAHVDTSGCFAGDTLIYTSDGIKEIKEINSGDNIINSDFKEVHLNKCKKKFTYKSKQLFKITTKTGQDIMVTPNHKIFVAEGVDKKKINMHGLSRRRQKCKQRELDKIYIIEKRVDEIKKGDYLLTPNKIPFPQRQVQLPTPKYNNTVISTKEEKELITKLHKKGNSGYKIGKITGMNCQRIYSVINNKLKRVHPELPKYMTPDFAQLLGYITADGNKSMNKKSNYIAVTDKDRSNLEEYERISQTLKINPMIKIYSKGINARQRLYLHSKEFTFYLWKHFREIIVRSRMRTIPNYITKGDDKIIAAYIRGFYDGEGCVGDHHLMIDNTSHKLIKQLRLMLLRLGIHCTVYDNLMPERKIRDHTIKETLSYRLIIYGKDDIRTFYDIIGVTRRDKQDKIEKIIKTKLTCNRKGIKYSNDIFLEQVKNIEEIKHKEKIDVYDLEVDKIHNYFAEGILAHNSISQTELTEFLGEILSIANSFQNIRITLIECDCAIHQVIEIGPTNIHEIGEMKIKGSGGTSHEPIWRYVEENIPNCKLLVSLTDGYSDIKIENEANYNVIWVLCKNAADDNAFPYGQIVRLEE